MRIGGGAGKYKRRDLKKTEHNAQKGAKSKRKKVNRKPKGTVTKAGSRKPRANSNTARHAAEHGTQQGSKGKSNRAGRKPKGTVTKAGSRSPRKTTHKRDGTKRGSDKYGVGKYKKGTSKRKSGGSRVMRGKAGSDAMYVYDRKLGTYKKTTKAAVKKMEKSEGVGRTNASRYRLVTQGTYNRAKNQNLTKTNNVHSYAKPKHTNIRARRKPGKRRGSKA